MAGYETSDRITHSVGLFLFTSVILDGLFAIHWCFVEYSSTRVL